MKIFNNLQQGGGFHLNGIGTSFFTKIFQFYYANNINQINPYPIIADQWSMKAVLADMLCTGYAWNNVFRKPRMQNNTLKVEFNSAPNNQFQCYWEFISYVSERVNQLAAQFPGLNSHKLEEYIFGWRNNIPIPNNPRDLATQIIRKSFNI